MVELAQLIYSRYLSNTAGGNMSCRAGDRIYITPRYLGSRHRWQLTEEMVLVCDLDGQVIEGIGGMVSREGRMHFACYQQFSALNGVIHAHPRYLSVFAAAGRALGPTNEYTEKFGTVDVVPFFPSHTQELADAVVQQIAPRQAELAEHGLGLVLAWHGFVAVGRDLADAYDTLERLEWSARTLLLGRLLDDQR